MSNAKFILIPSADSVPHTLAKFTKGKRYEGEPFTKYAETTLYKVADDNGNQYAINPKDSYYIGGKHFSIEVHFNNVCANGGFATGGFVDGKAIAFGATGAVGKIMSDISALGFIKPENYNKADISQDKLTSVETWELNESGTAIFKAANIGDGKIKIEPTIKVKDNDDATDALLNAMIRGGIGWAIDKIKSDNFMREPFSRIAELEKQVDALTGELNAAHNTIAKVREIMRSEPGYDIQDHARVLRMMADALLKLQK